VKKRIEKMMLFVLMGMLCILLLCACGSENKNVENSNSESDEFISASDLESDSYSSALADLEAGKYEDALAAFIDLGEYEDSEIKAKECYYEIGSDYEDKEDLENAAENYKLADDYLDAAESYSRCNYKLASKAIENEKCDEAIELLTDNDYEDSEELLETAVMQKGMHECADYEFIDALEEALEYRLSTTADDSYITIVNTELGRLEKYEDKEYYNEYIAYYVEKYIGGLKMQQDALNYNYSDFQIKWQEGGVERYQVVAWLNEYFGAYEDNQEILDEYVYQLDSVKATLEFYKTANADMLEQLDGAMWDTVSENEISYPYYNNTDYNINVTFYFFFYDSAGTRIDDNIVSYSDIRPNSQIDVTTYCPVRAGDSFEFFWEYF